MQLFSPPPSCPPPAPAAELVMGCLGGSLKQAVQVLDARSRCKDETGSFTTRLRLFPSMFVT